MLGTLKFIFIYCPIHFSKVNLLIPAVANMWQTASTLILPKHVLYLGDFLKKIFESLLYVWYNAAFFTFVNAFSNCTIKLQVEYFEYWLKKMCIVVYLGYLYFLLHRRNHKNQAHKYTYLNLIIGQSGKLNA